MSEPTQEPVPQPDEQAAQAGDPLGDAGKKAVEVERRARSAAERHARDLEARIKAMEDRDLSDLDKARRDAAEHKELARQARAEASRYKIAAAYGLSDDEAEKFLHGDERSMTSAAADLRALKDAAQQATAAPPTGPGPAPRPDLSQGARSAVGLNSDQLTADLERMLGPPRR